MVFEYGTLLDGIGDWSGLRVLDVGTGRSTLPQWMRHQGARVMSFDLPTPAEDGGAASKNASTGWWRGEPACFQPGGLDARPALRDACFDLVTSLSVVEHLDTDLPARAFVPYREQ